MTESRATAGSLEDMVRLRDVRDRIDRDFAQHLTVSELARDAGMSSAHLSRLFRGAYGEPPYRYLMTRRVERAMMLLRRGDLSVTQVCFDVGFSSLGTFSSRFRELVGLSPRSYRARVEVPAGLAPCVTRSVTRPIRNREVSRARTSLS